MLKILFNSFSSRLIVLYTSAWELIISRVFFVWQGIAADGTLDDECTVYDKTDGNFITITELQLFQNI